jgi:hypothetical protein
MALRLKLGGDVLSDRLRPLTRYRASFFARATIATAQAFRVHSGRRAYQGTGRVERTRLEENAMLKMIALIGVGTAIAFTPLPTGPLD